MLKKITLPTKIKYRDLFSSKAWTQREDRSHRNFVLKVKLVLSPRPIVPYVHDSHEYESKNKRHPSSLRNLHERGRKIYSFNDPKNARKARENIMFLCQTKMMIIDIKNVVTNITVMHVIPEIQKTQCLDSQ
jgi:hypothetical protein